MITIDNIHAAGNFFEPVDLPELTLNLDHASGATHVLVIKDGKVWRHVKSKYYGQGQFTPTLKGPDGSNINANTSGDIVSTLNGAWRVDAAGQLKFWTNNHLIITCTKLTTANVAVYSKIQLLPALSGLNVYADDFIQWSTREGKANIEDISTQDTVFEALRPRKFTVEGKERYGFILEEAPPELVEQTSDPEGNPLQGLSGFGILTFLFAFVKKLARRVKTLEEKGGI